MKIIDKYHGFAVFMAIFLCIILATFAYFLSAYTLIDFHIPIAWSALAAFLSGIAMWKSRLWTWLTRTSAFLPNYFCHVTCTGIFILAIFYICNFAFADNAASHTEKTVVEQTYHKVRHKTRRIANRRYAKGEAYNVYYMKVRFDTGSIKELMIKKQKFAQLHKGDTVPLQVSKGLFGVPVIK